MRARTVVILLAVVAVLGIAGGLFWLVLSDASPGPGTPAVVPGGETPLTAGGSDPDSDDRLVDRPRERQPRPANPPAPGTPWVPAAGFEDALAAIDWSAAGTLMRELVPLLADAAVASIRADEIRGSDAMRAAELREKLAAVAGGDAGVFPSVHPSGALTHPAFAANLAAATLHARSAGLSDDQLEALRSLLAEALTAEGATGREIDTTSFVATRIADEYARRARFYDALDALLTDKQRTALHSSAARDRVRLDPLSAAAAWDDRMRVAMMTDDESLFHVLAGAVMGGLGFDPTREERALVTLRAEIAALDPEMLPAETTFTSVMGFPRGERVEAWARWKSEVVRTILLQAMEGRIPQLPPDVVTDVDVIVRDPSHRE